MKNVKGERKTKVLDRDGRNQGVIGDLGRPGMNSSDVGMKEASGASSELSKHEQGRDTFAKEAKDRGEREAGKGVGSGNIGRNGFVGGRCRRRAT